MNDADAWFKEGMKDILLSWHADYQSELRGDLEDAIAKFDRALALSPDHADAWIQKGLALGRLGRHEDAAATLAVAVRLRPEDAELWLQWASSLACLKRHPEALSAFDETLRRRPFDVEARIKKAEVLDELGRDADALAAWEEVLRQPDLLTINLHSRIMRIATFDVRRLRARLARAGALARLGRSGEAVAAYRELLEVGQLGEAAADFHAALRTVAAARAAYHEQLQLRADSPEAWRRAGHAYLCAHRAAESLTAYETAIHLAKDDADAWLGKAEALVQAGRRQESIAAYQQALRIRPDFFAASARLRVVLAQDAPPARWKVMGHDTFAREEFVVGEFATEEEARKCALARATANDGSQDEALRDSYWIVPPQ